MFGTRGLQPRFARSRGLQPRFARSRGLQPRFARCGTLNAPDRRDKMMIAQVRSATMSATSPRSSHLGPVNRVEGSVQFDEFGSIIRPQVSHLGKTRLKPRVPGAQIYLFHFDVAHRLCSSDEPAQQSLARRPGTMAGVPRRPTARPTPRLAARLLRSVGKE